MRRSKEKYILKKTSYQADLREHKKRPRVASIKVDLADYVYGLTKPQHACQFTEERWVEGCSLLCPSLLKRDYLKVVVS